LPQIKEARMKKGEMLKQVQYDKKGMTLPFVTARR
jgi:hypothetical protein